MPLGRWCVSLAAAGLLAGCATAAPVAGNATSGPLRVVAAENFWGSIAAQLGGPKVAVTSVIDKPGLDPHDYEPTAADARAFAKAELVVVNGIGYDPWAERLLSSDPVGRRVVVKVGTVVGIAPGGNPHRWYDPGDVEKVIAAVTTALQTLDPRDAAYFSMQRAAFESRGLADYHRLIGLIRARYAGTPVGASESIFALMAPALGLDLLTPTSFMTAVSEGAEPSSGAKTTADQQIRSHAIKVFVYNGQNTTPDVRAQIDAARRQGIPVITFTETPTPAGATFEQWQVRQLTELAAALAKASGT